MIVLLYPSKSGVIFKIQDLYRLILGHYQQNMKY